MNDLIPRPRRLASWIVATALLVVPLSSAVGEEVAEDPSPAFSSTFAAIDFVPVAGDPASNQERLGELIATAARQGARYIVLPELGLQGRPWNEVAETIPGPSTELFGQHARAHDVWLVVPLLERVEGGDGYYESMVLIDHQGEPIVSYRKVMVRNGGEDGNAERGGFRETIYTVEDRGLRLGIISGADLQVGVPRLANQGADTILISAGWKSDSLVPWDKISKELSQKFKVHLVVANQRQGDGSGGIRSTVYTRHGSVFRPSGDGDELVVASMLRRPLPRWTRSALGLPTSIPVPAHVPENEAVVELGRRLFFDPTLSSTGTISCSTCHKPHLAFTNGEATGVGVFDRKTKRNVPTLLNVAFRPLLRWDGYASMIENFVKYPISGYDEMNFHYLDKAVPYLASHPEYMPMFRESMGVEKLNFDHVERALATYQRTLISGSSAFDRYYYGGEKDALSDSARRGLELFQGTAGCSGCHLIGESYALFMDHDFHYLGLGYDPEPGASPDIGLGSISTNALAGLFLTPSLRNVALTPPYMHNGSFGSLEEVLEFYDKGGNRDAGREPDVEPLHLTTQEKADLVAFLRSLSGDHHYDDEGRPVVEEVKVQVAGEAGHAETEESKHSGAR